MWHGDQKSVCALVLTIHQRGPDVMTDTSSEAFAGCMHVVTVLLLLMYRPLSKRFRHQDRVDLMGLRWLYGIGEFLRPLLVLAVVDVRTDASS